MKIPCEKCGSQVKRSGSRFCSRKCAHSAKILHARRACEQCGVTYKPKNVETRFCSATCAGAAYSLEQRTDPVERFWSHVDKNGPLPNQADLGNCWVWSGGVDGDGYGKFALESKLQVRSNVYALELLLGRKLLDGKISMHLCDNPGCVRHVVEGTTAENNRDRALKGRSNPARGDAHWTRKDPERIRALKGKLSLAQVEEIRSLLGFVSYSKLAIGFGVSKSAIQHIAKERHWKPVVVEQHPTA